MNDFEKGQWREGVEPDMQIHGTPAQVVAIVERGDIGPAVRVYRTQKAVPLLDEPRDLFVFAYDEADRLICKGPAFVTLPQCCEWGRVFVEAYRLAADRYAPSVLSHLHASALASQLATRCAELEREVMRLKSALNAGYGR